MRHTVALLVAIFTAFSPVQEFNLTIKGVKASYKDLEKMTFDITPSKDGYLKIVLADQSRRLSILYPGPYDVVVPLKGKQDYTFSYQAYTENTEEVDHLYFIYSRKNIPYNEDQSFAAFLEYVNSLDAADRFITTTQIRVYK